MIICKVNKYCHTCLSLLLLATLSGCFPFGVVETILVASSIPLTFDKEEGTVDLDGYSIGPVLSDEFPEFVSSAFPSVESAPFAEGWAQWTGLRDVKQNHVNQSVVVFTDSEIDFLWWHETRNRYERLIRLPYSDFYSVTLKRSGPGAVISFCHKNTEIPIGDKAIIIDRNTLFGFKKSDAAGDWQKTEQVFLALDQKVQPGQEVELHEDCGTELL